MGLLSPGAKFRAHCARGSRRHRDRRDGRSRRRLRTDRAPGRAGENAACRARHRDQRPSDRGAVGDAGRRHGIGKRCCRCSNCSTCGCKRGGACAKTRTAATRISARNTTSRRRCGAANPTAFAGIAARTNRSAGAGYPDWASRAGGAAAFDRGSRAGQRGRFAHHCPVANATRRRECGGSASRSPAR